VETKKTNFKEEKQIIKDEISDNYEDDDDWNMSDQDLMLEDNTKKPTKAAPSKGPTNKVVVEAPTPDKAKIDKQANIDFFGTGFEDNE
jgi:recombination DNA repair RAD52 pathway protein